MVERFEEFFKTGRSTSVSKKKGSCASLIFLFGSLAADVHHFEMPANGFEPMAFALQKRCSTTELSRQSWKCNDGGGCFWLTVGNQPQGEFESALTAGFGEGMADVTFHGSWTKDQSLCDGFVTETLKQQSHHGLLRWA